MTIATGIEALELNESGCGKLKLFFQSDFRVKIYFLFSFKEGEDAIQFANRVKKDIALQGGLVDMSWLVFILIICR